jgi:DNA-binding MarR family transcriptional regulator
MTEVVDRLEKEGFVERIRDTEDRRVVKVQLTDPGKEAHKGILKSRKQQLEILFGCLDQKERLRFLSSLRTASSTMKHVAGNKQEG